MAVLPREPGACEFLLRGTIEVEGRLVAASNTTLFCGITADGVDAHCVYKPISGERPLWDFPDGTLAGREVASYRLSEAAGLHVVPPTVMRQGPFGPGMVQLWVDTHPETEFVDVTAPDEVPPGWRVVLHAHDRLGEPAVLAHADTPSIRNMAALDVVLNNTDRKGGHLLAGVDGEVYGVDHGICLHTEDKLRTVLWGFLDEPLAEEAVCALRKLRAAVDADIAEELSQYLTVAELAALRRRTDHLLASGVYPEPSNTWRTIPWPPF